MIRMRTAAARLAVLAALAAVASRPAPSAAGPQIAEAKDLNSKAYEAVSLAGERFVSPPADKAAVERYGEARRRWARDPSEENAIGLGRAAGNAGRYREAIRAFSDGLSRYPLSYRLLRHRGHRYITIRQLVRAIDDLGRAAELVAGRPLEVEPDVPVSPSRKPLSNLQYDIFYHLGLAYFLAGDYPLAERALREALTWARNDDTKVAATDWLYLALRRMRMDAEARDAAASIRVRGIDLRENFGYFQRILLYRGMAAPELMPLPWDDDPPDQKKANLLIRLYGLANWHLWGGDAMRAMGVYETILKEKAWPYFASIAAEADAAGLMLANPARSTVADALKTWTLMENSRDLGLVYALFTAAPPPAYALSDGKDAVSGLDAIAESFKARGFVAGGRAQDVRFWLEDIQIKMEAGAPATAAARWFLDGNVGEEGPLRHGTAAFVYVQAADGFRVSQARFLND